MTFISELKRRNVFKVGVAYAIVAWLLIQVADTLLPAFGAPEWVLPVFTLLLAMGFIVALILVWAYELTPEGLKPTTAVEPQESITHLTGQKLNYGILGLLVLAVGFMVVDQYILESDETIAEIAQLQPDEIATAAAPPVPIQTVKRWDLFLEGTQTLGNSGLRAEVAISPDGSRIAYSANLGDGLQLYTRVLDQFEAQAIPGTEGARNPIFSPDGEWIVFNTALGAVLKKVSIRGGPPQIINEELFRTYGGDWATDDSVFISTTNGENVLQGYLARIPSNGGRLEVLSTPRSGESHVFPSVLPGGTHVLYTNRQIDAPAGNANISLLSLDGGESRPIIASAYNARYVDTGHIIFARDGALWGVPFDLGKLEVAGVETPLVERVQMNNLLGFAPYGFSDAGLLVYVRGDEAVGAGVGGNVRELLWVDDSGQIEPIAIDPRVYLDHRLSPDGQRIAVRVSTDGAQDIYIHDIARGILSRLTFHSATDQDPVWSPDGQTIYFASERDPMGVFSRAANGTGQAEPVATGILSPQFVTPDGSFIVMEQGDGDNRDIVILELESDNGIQALIETDFNERFPALSPDAEWLAYTSDESGQFEVYVRPFPNIDEGKWQISSSGGGAPLWSNDGTKLFYWSGSDIEGHRVVYAADIATEPHFTASTPVELFSGEFMWGSPGWDISPDNQKFLITRSANLSGPIGRPSSIAFVDNWFEELKRLAPVEAQ